MLQPEDETLPAQPGGCANCHAGLGAKPNNPPTEADLENVDCLICHSPDYRRAPVKTEEGTFVFGPAEGVDLLAAAQAAQAPTREMCSRCHLGAAGGANYKHGDYPTSPEVDVHMAAGLECVDCHRTQEHKIAGGGYMIAHDLPEVEVACSNCHSDAPHKSGMATALNGHNDRVACQTCHIPAIARDPDYPTQMTRDYTVAAYNEATGLYGPTVGKENDVIPIYLWWDEHGMETPPKPVGTIDDPGAKITPWKPMEVTVPFDAATDTPVYIKQGVYKITGDLDAAVTAGVEASGQEYSGEWEAITELMYFDVQHQVAPASEALTCGDCHAEDGWLDFAALGYDEERVAALTNLGGWEPEGGEYALDIPAGLVTNEGCLACHSEPGLVTELSNGEQLYLTIDEQTYAQTVHGKAGYACVQCHTDIRGYPHQPLTAGNLRELTVNKNYTTCKHCHEDKYGETLDSVHQRALAGGNPAAAVCSDCHGAHDVAPAGKPHSVTSNMCEKCHSEIYQEYYHSVHGSALIDEGNPDVPSCTDCHGVHDLEGPDVSYQFHLQSHEICARCHSNEALMARYDLNADVYDTYVADFHGTTVLLYEATLPGEETNKPVCVDCHGVHDILAADDPNSHVIKENLLGTCQRCHPDATLDFPDSWMSHYRADRDSTPLVYYVDLFYKILIPTVLGGMIMFNMTDVYRAIRQRLQGHTEVHYD